MFLYEEVNWKGRILQVIARHWLIANAIHIVRHCLKESNERFGNKFCIYILFFGGRANINFSVDFLQPVWKIQRVVSTRKIYSCFFLYCPTFSTYTNTVHCLGIQNKNSRKSELYVQQKSREIQVMWRGITPEVKHGVSISRSRNHFYYLARLPHRHHHRLHCLHLFLHRDSKNLLDKSKKVLSLLTKV